MARRERILVTGATGLLAPYLVDTAARDADVITTARSGGDIRCDLADTAATATLVKRALPDFVLHAAAMTDVDGCERDPAAADRANHIATANLAAALPADGRLVMISTDQVYPNGPGPHREGSESPVNAYGASKLAGERAALGHPGGFVARTSFFGASRSMNRSSLSDFVIDSLRARRPVTLFRDVLFSPLHASTLAALLLEIVRRGLTGTYNVAARDGMSKAEFGLQVAQRFELPTDSVALGDSAAVAGRAQRPLDLRMSPARLERVLGRPMPTLAEEIGKL